MARMELSIPSQMLFISLDFVLWGRGSCTVQSMGSLWIYIYELCPLFVAFVALECGLWVTSSKIVICDRCGCQDEMKLS